jgi:hypothetical protein
MQNPELFYVCIHGVETENKEGCVCDEGWTTPAEAFGQFDPSRGPLLLCNVRGEDDPSRIHPEDTVSRIWELIY